MSLYGVPQAKLAPRRFVACRWRDMRAAFARWFDRERELIRMRVAMGMMAEARQNDADEYHAMIEHSRRLAEKLHALEIERDAWRKARQHPEGKT